MKEATVTRGVGRFILLHVTNFLVDYGAESSAKNVGEKLTVRVPVDSSGNSATIRYQESLLNRR